MNKYGLRGFALGIFVTCALVAIEFFMFSSPVHAVKEQTSTALTEANVDQFLATKGEIAVDQATFNKWQSDQKSGQTKASTNQAPSASSNSNSITQKTIIQTTIKVTGSMGVWDVATELEQDKIIKDKQALYDYMLHNHLDKYLQLGSFKVTNQMTTAQIAKVLTKNR